MSPELEHRPRRAKKVFGIGFHKTGTSSLAAALRKLGFAVAGFAEAEGIDSANEWNSIKVLIREFDAFQDNPWPLLFRELHAYRPRAKFVLTVRPSENWIHSVVSHFGAQSTPMRERIYGVGAPVGHEACYIERYERHNRDVLEFFSDKPGSLLVMDLAAGDGWRELCPFVGSRRTPTRPFPHVRAR